VATEAAWLNGNNLKKKKTKKKEDKMKESLDTHRPSHGRTSSLNGNMPSTQTACQPGRARRSLMISPQDNFISQPEM
jgi:hypothetical protein